MPGGGRLTASLGSFTHCVLPDSANESGSVFLARDRIGIKPLYYYQDQDKVIFASEMKALMAFDIKREIDQVSLFQYMQLNYIPYPSSIISNIQKLKHKF